MTPQMLASLGDGRSQLGGPKKQDMGAHISSAGMAKLTHKETSNGTTNPHFQHTSHKLLNKEIDRKEVPKAAHFLCPGNLRSDYLSTSKAMKFLFQCPCCSCFCFMKPKQGRAKVKEIKEKETKVEAKVEEKVEEKKD
ncbi:hypothetical protein VNO78_13594 [Psophocarpus tetragonolobus]|uniref:Uncharacterized protein n=1 Tax=Psophocarpus tetragonolobus TaxID=3891 RepID=A0AAN9SQI3_PSOTE